MLLKNCYIKMNINFHLGKQEQHFPVTALPKIVGTSLKKTPYARFKHCAIVVLNSIVLDSTSVQLQHES